MSVSVIRYDTVNALRVAYQRYVSRPTQGQPLNTLTVNSLYHVFIHVSFSISHARHDELVFINNINVVEMQA